MPAEHIGDLTGFDAGRQTENNQQSADSQLSHTPQTSFFHGNRSPLLPPGF
jgi:hypothetical protein